MQTLFDNAPAVIFFKDLEGNYILVNKLFEKLHHLSRQDILGKTDKDLYSEKVARKINALEKQVIESKRAVNIEEILQFGDETKITLTSRFPLLDSKDKIYGFGGIATDVSKFKKVQESLEESNFIFARQVGELETSHREVKLLLEVVNALYDSHGLEEAHEFIQQFWQHHFKVASGALYLKQSPSSINKLISSWGQNIHPTAIDKDSCRACQQAMPLHVQTENHPSENCCSLPTKGDLHTLLCLPLKVYNESFGLLHLSFTEKVSKTLGERDFELIQAISQQMALSLSHSLLLEKVLHDPLTSLFNDRFMLESLERELNQAKRNQTITSIIIIDIDHLKDINNQYGYDVGDKVLCEFANLLKDCFRKADLVCRYGGDEFAIILPNCSLERALNRAEQFNLVTRNFKIAAKNQKIDFLPISVGVASSNEQTVSARELLHNSLAAMHEAKTKGGNQVIAN